MKQLTYILVGAGQRGEGYSKIATETPDKFKCVGVAEPVEVRRNNAKEQFNIPDDMCFSNYNDIFAKGKIADFCMVCTQDRMHTEPALKAIELGYNLLLEKPAAPTAEECMKICKAAENKGVKVIVCHVLRYTPFYRTIKEIIDSGKIGKVMSVIATEGVGNYHQSHSYVRGNWHNSKTSAPMLLAKSCHDIDIIQWLIGNKCKKVQSFGSLSYFKKENAPKDAPERCIDGCPHAEDCPYDAVRLYLKDEKNNWFRSAAANSVHPDNAEVEKALRETTYGKCIFKCDNDVVDHQTVNMEFENGETVVFTMAAFNWGGRWLRVMGTKGEIYSKDMENIEMITFYDTNKDSPDYKKTHKECFKASDNIVQDITGGHGGGDEGLIKDLYPYFAEGKASKSISEIEISTLSHMTVFAAEKSRAENTVVDLDEFMKDYE